MDNLDNLDTQNGSKTRKYYVNHQNKLINKSRHNSNKCHSQGKVYHDNFDIVNIT